MNIIDERERIVHHVTENLGQGYVVVPNFSKQRGEARYQRKLPGMKGSLAEVS